MLTDRTTLTEFLIEERRRYPGATGDLNALIIDIALACKMIAGRVGGGALAGALGTADTVDASGELQTRLDAQANDDFIRTTEWGGHLAGLVSDAMEAPYPIPADYRKGKYLLVFDPLDGSSGIDVNVPVGSIFSILRAPRAEEAADTADFLQPGTRQVCAGYTIYGPATMLVLTVGSGVHGFTLERSLGEFILTHEAITIPAGTSEFAINASNSRFWEPAVKRYVDECIAGATGPRGRDFNMRWIASLVAETHRILLRGGVFMYPRDTKRDGKVRLLYEASPIAFLVEQAGGKASTGQERLLDVEPEELHQRIGLIFGSHDEVDLIERYHQEEDPASEYNAPLFGSRGLFRESA